MFKISSSAATLFTIPATYATAYGFIYAYGKLLVAMANSKLFPNWLRLRTNTGAPYVALILGSLLGYVLCVVVYFVPFIGAQLFNICILSGFIAYMAQCVGYIYLSTRFSNLPRAYRSPLGLFGAIYSFIIWTLGAISIIGFQNDYQFAFIVIICIITLLSIYYYNYAKRRQTFSEEEKKILFVAHVVNRKYSMIYHRICVHTCI